METFPLVEIGLTCPECRGSVTAQCRGMGFPAVVQCPVCHAEVLITRRVQGIVYILSNPRMPGILKLGFTTRLIDERLSELNNATGVPAAFVTECLVYSDSPERDEAEIHRRMGATRLPNREFFEAERGLAIATCEAVCKRKAHFVRPMSQPAPKENTRTGPGALRKGGHWVCPKCGRRLKRRARSKGWACSSCSAFFDRAGAPI